ncbi:MAG: mechanosensitive ion channel family protein, partial [Gemmatimonadota bacterium]|nr:mechanosensitive ion channel family protein [Gemmatimonadota bacterium]
MSFDIGVVWDSIRDMGHDFLTMLPNVVIAIVVFVVFLILAGWARAAARRVGETTNMESHAAIVVARMARWAVVAVGMLVAVSIVFPSVGAEELIGLLGVGGVAIGFAFRDVLQNFLAGILILIQQPFRVGDQIETDDGYIGTVQEIHTRATYIRTLDGRRVVIPNADLYTDPVEVYTAFETRRSEYDAGIGYPDDSDLAMERMVTAMKSAEGVLDDPEPEVIPVELGDSSVVLRARWWTASDQGTVTRTKGRVIAAIKRALDDAGIDIPYPVR